MQRKVQRKVLLQLCSRDGAWCSIRRVPDNTWERVIAMYSRYTLAGKYMSLCQGAVEMQHMISYVQFVNVTNLLTL